MALEGLDVCQIETERASFSIVVTIPKIIVLGIDYPPEYEKSRFASILTIWPESMLRLLGFHISLDFMYYFNCRHSYVV